MQIKETIGLSFTGSVESPPLEDVVVLVDSAGVALGVQRAFAQGRGVRDGGSGLIAFRCVQIPIVGSNGQVSGIFLPRQPAVRHARRSRRWRTAEGEDDSGRAQFVSTTSKIFSRYWQRPAVARVPEGFRSSKRPRRGDAGGAHARRVAHPAAPRYRATVPGSRSTGLSQAAALQRWRARLTGRCVPTSQSAPRSPRT
jgi:hypothetical protein